MSGTAVHRMLRLGPFELSTGERILRRDGRELSLRGRVMTEAYGQRLGEALRVENAPAIVTRALRTANIAVTEIRCDNPLPEMSGPIQREDAFLVTLHLSDSRNREYW